MVLAAIPTALVLALGALEALDRNLTLDLAIGLGVAELVGLGLVIARRSKMGVRRHDRLDVPDRLAGHGDRGPEDGRALVRCVRTGYRSRWPITWPRSRWSAATSTTPWTRPCSSRSWRPRTKWGASAACAPWSSAVRVPASARGWTSRCWGPTKASAPTSSPAVRTAIWATSRSAVRSPGRPCPCRSSRRCTATASAAGFRSPWGRTSASQRQTRSSRCSRSSGAWCPTWASPRPCSRWCAPDVARELTFTGRVVSGEEAQALGLVTRVAGEPLVAAQELATEIAGRSPDAVRAAKRALPRGPATVGGRRAVAGDRAADRPDRLAQPDSRRGGRDEEGAAGVRGPRLADELGPG